uniref:EF-hand domain-containing protein n=1 Tax=Entomoneis paludosa TaxID=265537 RepID=A0A7S2YP88_9STRA|mmetsp:Transcript_41100/g.85578  ORF Transcript_41100/g.85578 Transcript_41100/m.85578 type:complete len:211 (+) Transcript_41100:898-1530(+)
MTPIPNECTISYDSLNNIRFLPAQDLDGTGKIRYTEFLAATIEAQGAISEERLAEAFDRMDSDDSGFISKENLRALLGDEIPQAELDAIIDEADITRDGKISYSEFLALWEDKNEGNRQKQIQEVRELETSLQGTGSDRTHDYGTDNESDVEDSFNPVARSNFIDSKRNSERKANLEDELDELDEPLNSNNGKHVMFNDGAAPAIHVADV